MSTEPLSAGADRYLATGPLVWVAAIACTTLLLAVLEQALWLVVPVLLAIILYYALFPAVRRLTLTGMRRETAAASVAGGVFVAAPAARRPALPRLASRAGSGEGGELRHIEGGGSRTERPR